MLFGWLSSVRIALLSCLVAIMVAGCGAGTQGSVSPSATATVAAGSAADVAVAGTGSAGTSGSTTTGSLALMLTDAPSDEFSEINLTISRVDLLASDGGKFELFSGRQVVNLLGLRNYSNLFSVNHDVPPGLYNKIRFYLDDVELVRSDSSGAVIERIHPKLRANGKLDLNPRTEFAIGPGKSMVLQLDLDAKKSVQLHQTGGGKGKGKQEYIFRPVVFIDLVDMVNFGGKLVRVEGSVSAIDAAAGTVELCNIKGSSDGHCVLVSANGTTTLYNRGGQLITLAAATNVDYGVAVGYMSLVGGQNRLTAETIELGRRSNYLDEFWHVAGNVSVLPVDDSHQFYFAIQPMNYFPPGEQFRVLPLPGAKLFSSSGVPLDWSALGIGKVVEIEGLLDHLSGTPYTFMATIIYLDMSQTTTQVSGVISSVDTVNNSLMVATADMGDLCVVASASVNVYQVNGSADTGYSGERISFDQIKSGQSGDLYGQMDSGGCFAADDILVQ